MSSENGIAETGQRWAGWARIVGAGIAIIVFLLGSGFFYTEVWNAPVLSYTILPTYDLGSQAFSGVIVENRGRVVLTDVQVIIDDLDAPIEALNIPGPHEPANVEAGGEGERNLRIVAERLSTEASLPIYLLTGGPVELSEDTLLVAANETRGERNIGSNMGSIDADLVVSAIAVVIGLSGLAYIFGYARGMLWKS